MSDLMWIGLMILFGALFAMSEIGMAAARKIKLRVMSEDGYEKAENGITNAILRLLNLPTKQEELVTTEDIVAIMDAGAEDGSLQKQDVR